ncbi:OmpA family protein [Kaarinaea lacus]
MNRRKIRFIENLIIVTFPVVLFAGCAGSDIKPGVEEKSLATYSGYEHPLPENDLMDISTAYDTPNETQLSVAELYPVRDTSIDQEQTTENQEQTTQANNLTPELPTNNLLKFGTDIHELANDQRIELEQHAEFLIAHPDMVLVINGHADIRGTEQYNQKLSEKRAQAVYDLLIDLGVSQGQLKIFGLGEHQPMQDENDWDENRRVELEFKNPVILSSMQ